MTDADVFAGDLAEQPEAFERLARAYRDADGPLAELRSEKRTRVRFVGIGSSAYASTFAVPLLRAHGIDAAVESPESEAGTPPDPSLIVFLVSATGRSPETLRAAERHAGVSRTIALTNDVASPLASVADGVLPLLAGPERSGIASRSYRATVAVARLVAERLTGRPSSAPVLLEAADATARVLGDSGSLDDATALLEGAGSISVAAPAHRIGSARQGALMMQECARIPAAGYDTSEWSHVGLYLTIHADHRTVVFTGSEGETELAGWTRHRGVPVVAIGADLPAADTRVQLPGPGLLAALVETVVTDLLSMRLWQLRGGMVPADLAGRAAVVANGAPSASARRAPAASPQPRPARR